MHRPLAQRRIRQGMLGRGRAVLQAAVTVQSLEMVACPPCPLVLSLLACQPQPAHEVARALGRAVPQTNLASYPIAVTALERLRAEGLVRARVSPTATLYQITTSGRRELWLQRCIWLGLPRARYTAS